MRGEGASGGIRRIEAGVAQAVAAQQQGTSGQARSEIAGHVQSQGQRPVALPCGRGGQDEALLQAERTVAVPLREPLAAIANLARCCHRAHGTGCGELAVAADGSEGQAQRSGIALLAEEQAIGVEMQVQLRDRIDTGIPPRRACTSRISERSETVGRGGGVEGGGQGGGAHRDA